MSEKFSPQLRTDVPFCIRCYDGSFYVQAVKQLCDFLNFDLFQASESSQTSDLHDQCNEMDGALSGPARPVLLNIPGD